MSGIIAYVGTERAAPILLDGLRRLLWRGHDSAGLALLARRRLRVWRAVGPLVALERRVPANAAGRAGIAHLRLATHGAPSEVNAHPQIGGDGRVALAHNGIVENADALRRELVAEGVEFRSETDTEVLAQLLARRLEQLGEPLEAALGAVLERVHGTCGLAALDRETPERVVVARIGSPLVVGAGGGASVAASDAELVRRIVSRGGAGETVALEDGELALLTPDGFAVTSGTRAATRSGAAGAEARAGAASDAATSDGGAADADAPSGHVVRHEIVETPAAIARALAGRLDRRFSDARLGGLNLAPERLREVRRVLLLGAGSAWHAALSGARMIESLARLPANAEPAGEFRGRAPVIEPDTLYLVASRSGETFDTLAALREIRRRGGTVLGIVNDVGSSVAREVDGGIYLHAGPERSIVATKSVSAMLSVFALLALALGRSRDVSPQRGARLLDAFEALPAQIDALLADEGRIARLAPSLARAETVFLLGRSSAWPLALEGARKLVEIAAVHAEAVPETELGHGPVTLLGPATPCVAVLPETDLLPASLATLERVKARGAPLVVIGASDTERAAELADERLLLPSTETLLEPVLGGVALQLLALHVGLARGRDVDRPHSLSGSVTVE